MAQTLQNVLYLPTPKLSLRRDGLTEASHNQAEASLAAFGSSSGESTSGNQTQGD